jgi:hypothetical protein
MFFPKKGFMTDRNTPQHLHRSPLSDDPAGEEARCGGPGLVAYGREMDIKFSGNISAVSMPIARSLKT